MKRGRWAKNIPDDHEPGHADKVVVLIWKGWGNRWSQLVNQKYK